MMIGGVPIADRLRAARALPKEMVRAFVATIDPYRTLPPEELEGDITRITAVNIRLFINLLETGQLPTEHDLNEIALSSVQRAEEGIPLDAVLSAYHVGIRTGWEEVTEHAGPEDVATLRRTTSLLMQYLQLMTATATAAYLAHQQTVVNEQHIARSALAAELLRGVASAATAEQAGTRLADRYVVLCLAIGRHPDEENADVDPAIAGRRKVRRVLAELEKAAPATPLSALRPDGGTVLIPGSADGAQLESLLTRLTAAAGTAITAATQQTSRDDIAAAAEQLPQVLELVQATGRPPGLYRLADVLLEYQLTRPGQARRDLAALLAPLDDHTELLETLKLHLGNDLNRRRTAGQLHIHINTVDYRLRRIAELTGLDPGKRTDLRYLEAALTARQLEHNQSRPHD
ncbi:PucR family transcriptional regulator [Kribbella deserti]|uniref:PucR family transcriptional regulator n=1 Tax=Kribbella deserti TaxID=1926257 RepID=A0ABV6QEN1_9ACTN